MKAVYSVQGYVFTKTREDSSGNCYFDITHPDGRKLDYNHLFSSEAEMVAWVRNRTY